MRVALIDNTGLVLNVILAGNDYVPPSGHSTVPDEGETATIGATWNGTEFVAPPAPAPDLVAYADQKKVAILGQGALHVGTGLHIPLDDASRADLSGMATTALATIGGALPWPDEYAQGWITIENVRIPMATAQDGLALAALAGAHYAAVVQLARTIKDQVIAGTITTTGEVDAQF